MLTSDTEKEAADNEARVVLDDAPARRSKVSFFQGEGRQKGML